MLDYLELIRRAAPGGATLSSFSRWGAEAAAHGAGGDALRILFGTMMAFWRLTRSNS